jgi:hypothetical protein
MSAAAAAASVDATVAAQRATLGVPDLGQRDSPADHSSTTGVGTALRVPTTVRSKCRRSVLAAGGLGALAIALGLSHPASEQRPFTGVATSVLRPGGRRLPKPRCPEGGHDLPESSSKRRTNSIPRARALQASAPLSMQSESGRPPALSESSGGHRVSRMSMCAHRSNLSAQATRRCLALRSTRPGISPCCWQ